MAKSDAPMSAAEHLAAKGKAGGEVVELNENVRLVGKNVWVEKGPAYKQGTATEELLDDANTAPHYFLPRRVKRGSQVMEEVARDANGNEIRPGKSFTYVDWMTPSDQWPWYVYQRSEREVFDHNEDGSVKMNAGKPVTKVEDYLHEAGVFNSEREALEFAKGLPQDLHVEARMNIDGERGAHVKAKHARFKEH